MQGLTLGHLSARNASKRPDEEAIVVHDGVERAETVTFGEFDRRVDRVANGLRERGLEQGDRVGVYTQNGVETLEVYVGAAKLGVLPVPVNHRFKAEEVRYVLDDSDAELLVFDEAAREEVERIEREDSPLDDYLYVGEGGPDFADSYEAFRAGAAADPVEVVPTRLDQATLMYTSGTTGKPKGCVLTHDNVVQNSENSVYLAGFDYTDRFLLVTPLFHVAAFALFLNTFYVGGATHVMDEFVPQDVMGVVEQEAITGSFFVPTMSRALLGVEGFDDYDISAFQHYMTGAAPSGEELKRTIIERFDADLYEAFGQTECSPVTAMLLPDEALEKPDSIGRPVINVEVKVVDEDDPTREVEQGEVGRAAYRGPTVFEGYYNMPEKNDAVFEGEWFVSGDLVREGEEGFLYFVGRYDDMIISGGENIYPAEVEEVLHEHEAVDESAVVGVPDETWGERVKAAIVLEDGADLTEAAVVDYVKSRLAGYKQPREVVFLDELPKNPTGKVLKDELT
ncbi:MAG: class I adenylate-forming enzyme family protein [Haloarculaceae archaeon]